MDRAKLKSWPWEKILIVLNIIGICGAMFCALWAFINESLSSRSVLVNIYILVFSLLVFIGYFKPPIVVRKFKFITLHMGRAMTLFFIGSMCFVFLYIPNIIFGLYLFFDFAVHIWVIYCLQPAFAKKEKDEQVEQIRAAGVSAKGEFNSAVREGAKEGVKEHVTETLTPSWAKGISPESENKAPQQNTSSQPSVSSNPFS
eukprot:c205_g1_i1.p1 GENE.c205_g1_i1~~c205_g1_i1.p1  ORF type:complete len:219 (-),score=45.43 c205_g1_i1:27-629(-)